MLTIHFFIEMYLCEAICLNSQVGGTPPTFLFGNIQILKWKFYKLLFI